jgi:hypothetical protein
MGEALRKTRDGTFEETFGAPWSAEYAEDAANGLWRVVVYRHDVIEWRGHGYASLEEARRAAEEFYRQV